MSYRVKFFIQAISPANISYESPIAEIKTHASNDAEAMSKAWRDFRSNYPQFPTQYVQTRSL